MELTGYRRPDGQVGVRNHVVVLPVDDLSNAAAEGVAELIPGAIALSHPYGRLQFGDDLDLTFATLSGHGRNPNVASVIVIGIEPKWTQRVAEGIEPTGKPIETFEIERHGDLHTIEQAAQAARQFVQDASDLDREPVEMGELTLSTKCGESDTTLGAAGNPAVGRTLDRLIEQGASVIFGETSELTGAEHILAERCVNDDVRQAFMDTYNAYIEFIEEQGVDLLGSQPTQGNIRGGLSTIEEKALGNIEKLGTTQIQSVLEPAQDPPQGTPGLHFMDTSSAAAEMVTLCAAAGSALHFFTTGQGNIVGHPLVPVVKVSPNPLTVETMGEHIDVALPDLLRGEIDLDGAADRIDDVFARTVRGRLTAAELLRHREFVLTKLYRSA